MRSRFLSEPSALLLLTLGLLVTLSAWSAVAPVDIAGYPPEIAADPGQLVTQGFSVINRGSSKLELTEELVLPEGWLPMTTADDIFALNPGDTQTRLMSIIVPKSAAIGRHEAVYLVRDRRDFSVLARARFTLFVRPSGRLDIVTGPNPKSILAGEPIRIPIALRNLGNCPVNLVLDWKTSPVATVNMPAREFALAAGETRELVAEVPTDAAVAKPLLHLLQLQTTATWAGGRTNVPVAAITVEVVPVRGEKFDPWVRLPARLTTTFGWEQGRDPGFQTELAGRGALDETGARRVDFRLRTPDSAGDNGSLRWPAEMGASLFSTNWDLLLGDRNFVLSPLLSGPLRQRGVQADWHPGATRFGMLATEGLGEFGSGNQLGGYVRHAWNESWMSGLNVLHVTDPTNGMASTLITAQSGWAVSNRFHLDLEAGMDDSAARPIDGLGLQAEARGLLGNRGAWSLVQWFAGPDFQGAQTDTASTGGSLLYELSDQWRLTAGGRTFANNLARNPAVSSVSAQESDWRGGVRYQLTRSLDLGGEYRFRHREDALAPAEYDYTEHAARLSTRWQAGRWRLELAQELGHAASAIPTPTDRGVGRSEVAAVWQGERQTFNTFVSYGASAMSIDSEPQLLASVGAQWRLGSQAAVTVNAAHEIRPESDGEKTSADMRVDWALRNRHQIAATARIAKSNDPAEAAASLYVSYSIPLGVPVARKRGMGTIHGSVVDRDGETPQPIAKAVVRLNSGATTTTDREGRFTFAGLPPGDYSVTVDQRSLGFGRVSAERIPGEIFVKGDSVTTIDIAVVTAATLTVQITVFTESLAPVGEPVPQSNPEDRFRPVGALAGEVVELSNGSETYRRLTGADGIVSFTNLRPGRWTMLAYDRALPPHHQIEQPRRELELLPQAKVVEAVRVLPRRRALQLIDTGTLN